MISDPSRVIFSTRYNFQKIYDNDNDVFEIPATGGTPTSVLLTTHSLDYIPTARVYYEPVSGELWPLSADQFSNADGGPGTSLLVYGSVRLTSSTLNVELHNNSGSDQNIRFYWRIYLDE